MQVRMHPEIKVRSRPYSQSGRCDKLFCQVGMEFWSNPSDCMARLGTNMNKYASEMELYII